MIRSKFTTQSTNTRVALVQAEIEDGLELQVGARLIEIRISGYLVMDCMSQL